MCTQLWLEKCKWKAKTPTTLKWCWGQSFMPYQWKSPLSRISWAGNYSCVWEEDNVMNGIIEPRRMEEEIYLFLVDPSMYICGGGIYLHFSSQILWEDFIGVKSSWHMALSFERNRASRLMSGILKIVGWGRRVALRWEVCDMQMMNDKSQHQNGWQRTNQM